MNNSKVAIVVSQIIEKIEIIAGGLWAFMFIVVALMGMFDSEKNGAGVIITMWIFGLFGIWVVWKGIRRKKMRLEFKKYVAELSYNPTGTIDNLAAATDTSVDVVKKNLKFMIKKRYFPNAFIDEKENRLVLLGKEQKVNGQVQNVDYNNIVDDHQQSVEYVTCHCKNCGGINKIVKGQTIECDFCGSPLTGK